MSEWPEIIARLDTFCVFSVCVFVHMRAHVCAGERAIGAHANITTSLPHRVRTFKQIICRSAPQATERTKHTHTHICGAYENDTHLLCMPHAGSRAPRVSVSHRKNVRVCVCVYGQAAIAAGPKVAA